MDNITLLKLFVLCEFVGDSHEAEDALKVKAEKLSSAFFAKHPRNYLDMLEDKRMVMILKTEDGFKLAITFLATDSKDANALINEFIGTAKLYNMNLNLVSKKESTDMMSYNKYFKKVGEIFEWTIDKELSGKTIQFQFLEQFDPNVCEIITFLRNALFSKEQAVFFKRIYDSKTLFKEFSDAGLSFEEWTTTMRLTEIQDSVDFKNLRKKSVTELLKIFPKEIVANIILSRCFSLRATEWYEKYENKKMPPNNWFELCKASIYYANECFKDLMKAGFITELENIIVTQIDPIKTGITFSTEVPEQIKLNTKIFLDEFAFLDILCNEKIYKVCSEMIYSVLKNLIINNEPGVEAIIYLAIFERQFIHAKWFYNLNYNLELRKFSNHEDKDNYGNQLMAVADKYRQNAWEKWHSAKQTTSNFFEWMLSAYEIQKISHLSALFFTEAEKIYKSINKFAEAKTAEQEEYSIEEIKAESGGSVEIYGLCFYPGAYDVITQVVINKSLDSALRSLRFARDAVPRIPNFVYEIMLDVLNKKQYTIENIYNYLNDLINEFDRKLSGFDLIYFRETLSLVLQEINSTVAYEAGK